MKAEGARYRVAVDFDGVLHEYSSPWIDAATIPDPPVPGAIEWLLRTLQRFDVAITSTRNHQPGGVSAMKAWLRKHAEPLLDEQPLLRGVEQITFPVEKPAALIYLDDRAIRFDGAHWPTPDEIHSARPWNRGGSSRIATEGPELVRHDTQIGGTAVTVRKLPDDPLCLRASLGGLSEMGFYLSYRGDGMRVRELLEAALSALKESLAN